MFCRFSELRDKMVINLTNGARLGSVGDLEIDTTRAAVVRLHVRGKLRLLGLLGRDEDISVEWSDIEVVGEDTVLVNLTPTAPALKEPSSKKKSKGRLFEILLEDD